MKDTQDKIGYCQLSLGLLYEDREFYANADTEMKRKAINAASSVIDITNTNTNDYDFDDEDLLKKLYSLK